MPLPAVLGGIAKVGAIIGKGTMAAGRGLAAGARASARVGTSVAKSGAKIGSRTARGGARTSIRTNKLKITTSKIKSDIFKANNKLKKIRKVEDSILKKVEDQRRKDEKAQSLKKKLEPAKKLSKKLIINPFMSLFQKIMEFFSLVVLAILVKGLPGVIRVMRKVFKIISNITKMAIKGLTVVGKTVGYFLNIFNNNPPPDLSKVDNEKQQIQDGLDKVNRQLEEVGVKSKEIEDEAKDKEKKFVEDKKKKDKSQEENSVKLSKSTASLVRTEYEQGKGKKDNKDQSKKEIQKQEPVVPRKETEKEVQEKMQGPPPGASEIDPLTNTPIFSAQNQNQGSDSTLIAQNNTDNNVQMMNKGGTVGGLASGAKDVANSVNSFKVFETNTIKTGSNLKDLQNNVSLFKEFGDNLIALSSNMSTSSDSGSSSSSFSIADSTSNLPIVGRVGSTGGSTGPHVHIQRFPQPTNWEQDHITKDHPVIQNILVGGKPLNEWEFTSASQPDRWGRPHYGPDFGGSGINNQPIQLTGGITYDPSSLYQESSGAEGNNILFNYGGEQFVIFHLNSGPEVKQVAGQGPLKSMSPVPLKRSGIDTEMGENVVFVYGVQHINTIVKV